jgi:bifunctional DNA-binding transcriptional regulator/antitoxin component of YhaV-PrlF toxin-antitoxin module
MRERLNIHTGDVLEIIHEYDSTKKTEAFQIIEEIEGLNYLNSNKKTKET